MASVIGKGCSITSKVMTRGFVDCKQLVKLKMKALRSGVWLKTLQRIERALIELTISVATIVRNAKLVKSILTVTTKLEGAVESRISRVFREIGLPVPQRLSLIAQKLDYDSAKTLASNSSITRFLAVLYLNQIYYSIYTIIQNGAYVWTTSNL